jgi:hypothetical protein
MLASLLHITPALAASDEDRFNLSVGAFFVTHTDGTVRLDHSVGPANIGTSIDWHRDLGGETNKTVPRIDGYYRFSAKHRVDFSWYSIDRSGLITTQRDIDFGNINFPAGTTIDSRLETKVFKVAYTYSFYRTADIETALTFGLHITNIKASLQSAGLGISEAESTTAPLPVFGYRIDYSLSPKWWVRSKYELFFLDRLKEVQGSLSDFTVAIEHRTFKHFGFGFGLDRTSANFDVSHNRKSLSLDSVLTGFMLYGVYR